VHSGARSFELVIGAVLFDQVAPVSAVFVAIPVMVIMMVAIVIPDVVVVVMSVILTSGLAQTFRWGKKGSGQEQGTEVST
jgi:hypothetical protein